VALRSCKPALSMPSVNGYPEANLIRYSVLSWFDFTSISHARDFAHEDSAPRITFGKITEADGRRTMPVSIHVHHALADGLQVAQFGGEVPTFPGCPRLRMCVAMRGPLGFQTDDEKPAQSTDPLLLPVCRPPCSHLSSEGRGVPGTLGRACNSTVSGCSTRNSVPLGIGSCARQNQTSICSLGLRRAFTED
jgi:hypothetical protein